MQVMASSQKIGSPLSRRQPFDLEHGSQLNAVRSPTQLSMDSIEEADSNEEHVIGLRRRLAGIKSVIKRIPDYACRSLLCQSAYHSRSPHNVKKPLKKDCPPHKSRSSVNSTTTPGRIRN